MEWNKIFITGIEEIDKQHKELFDTIKKLRKPNNEILKKEEAEEVLNYLVDYTKFHFTHEENYLKKINYSKFDEHKEIHQQFISELNALIVKYYQEENVSASTLYLFLIKWLQEHIAIEDQKYVKNVTKMSLKDFLTTIEPNLNKIEEKGINVDKKRISFLINFFNKININNSKILLTILKSSKLLLQQGIITLNEDIELRKHIVSKQNIKELLNSEDDLKYQIIELIDTLYDKDNILGHITGSCWILNSSLDSVLLTHHKKLNLWIQPGGHSEGEFNPLEISIREGKEESGLELILLDKQPYHLETFIIPKYKDMPEHKHFDYTYIFKSKTDNFIVSDESHDLKWVPLKDVEKISKENNVLTMRDKTYNFLK